MRRLIITGASGFIGGALARHMLRSKSYDEVWALSRRDPGIAGLHHLPVDLTQPQQLPALFDTADVVHVAGVAQDGWDPAIEQANQQITAHALQLAPGGRFIHISSSSVYDLGKPSVQIAEEAFHFVAYRFYNSYSRSKAQTEVLVQASTRAIAPVILRPHAVYGPGDTTLLPRLQQRVRLGTLVLPDAGRVAHTLTSVYNLVAAVDDALQLAPGRVEVYNVTDAEPVLLADAVRAHLPGRLRILGVPSSRLLEAQRWLPGISEYELRQLGFERTYDTRKAQTSFGYRPRPFNVFPHRLS